jgi:flavin reductase (DIM6/NTAB) family NADH-FMN oxidoreductase RutF
VFYMLPRPVYLVSVRHADAGNLFPMDLVGPLGDDAFLLALRLTSPAVETIRAAGRIVVSGAPARLKPAAYALGTHHKARSIDWDTLPLAVAPSPTFGIPAPVEATSRRELVVEQCQPVGSHMLFTTSVVNSTEAGDEEQLCHLSDMYARWRAAQGRSFSPA